VGIVNGDLSEKLKIVVTGGCGKIGSHFTRFAGDRYQIRVVDRVEWDAGTLGDFSGESLVLDLTQPENCRKACEGMDIVIHLAADPDPEADFLSSLLDNNVLSTYHMFAAAKAAGCKRFIFASSVHAVASYPRDVQVSADMPVRPTSMYGVSKCFGEALAAHFAVNEGLPSIAIRIGGYKFPQELDMEDRDFIDGYLHPDDFNQLLTRCIETPGITFLIAHAISNNRFKRIDLTETRKVLGYNPQIDGFDLLP
jgi:uronate dehydrogenase